jgi:NAD(P)-dependent dehydrogenase (short-subunit alcohol dehydrogenase family)
LAQRVSLITGAASGIGAACAQRFALEGSTVVGLDLHEPDAAAWSEVAGAAATVEFHSADVRDESRVAEVVAQTVARFGRLDVVVNAAGVAGGGPVHTVDAAEWDRVVDINLKGTFLVCKHALEPMLAQRSGSIVNVASVEGLEGTEGGSAYNASKGGVVLLTKNLAIDYGRKGIRANCICPGFIDTPLLTSVFEDEAMAPFLERFADCHQLGRLGKPEEVAAAALFLASDDASFVSGHALAVDGGFTAGKRVGFGKLMGLE